MDDLKSVVKGEVDGSSAALRAFNHDASIFEVTPQAVIAPKDETDLKHLVRYISERKHEGADVSITARNAGTCMSGGSLTEGYVVNMSRHMNKVGPADLHARTITVQGGAMHLDVEKATHPHKLLFAPYTSSRDICGIGGMLGNNASGEKSVKYGPTSANVSKLRVVLSDGEAYDFGPLTVRQLEKKKQLPTFEGELYRGLTKLLDDNWHTIDHHHPRTRKNAAGYALWELWDQQRSHFNMARLFIGAQGTLGIVSQAELKLVPMAPAQRMFVVPIAELHDLAPIVQTIMRYHPVTCETFDHFTYELAKQQHPEDAARASLAEGQHMVVMAMFEGDTQHKADVQAGQCKEELERQGRQVAWIDDHAVAESFLLIRRKSFKMLLEHPSPDTRAQAFLEDTIVPLEHYGEFLGALEAILQDYDMTYTYAGHIGDGSIRLIPLVNMEAEYAAERVFELETRVNDLVMAFGGSISVDHNDGLIRSPYLPQFFGDAMYQLLVQVKRLFDPQNIFNPGKKVGGDFDYSMAHIIRRNVG